jgi:hypothetical protein
MSITCNTYGLRSINSESFNVAEFTDYMPEIFRNHLNTALRINNLVFNVLGYMADMAPYSGFVRMGMAWGALMAVSSHKNPISDTWGKEAYCTAIAQIARGLLEATCPYGRALNLGLDIVATWINLNNEVEAQLSRDKNEPHLHKIYHGTSIYRHIDPDYNNLFKILYLV